MTDQQSPDGKSPDEKSPDEKSPVEQALELFVFAALGLAMTARTQLPDMVAKGRAQVEGQLTVARFIGQFAVQQGKAEVEKRLKAYTDPPVPPLDEEGLGGPAPSAPEDAQPQADDPTLSQTTPAPVPAQAAPEQPVASTSASGAPAPPVDELAIPGYDALSASQVVQRLAGLSLAELEQVRAYEAATRGRKTVLSKISQLH